MIFLSIVWGYEREHTNSWFHNGVNLEYVNFDMEYILYIEKERA